MLVFSGLGMAPTVGTYPIKCDQIGPTNNCGQGHGTMDPRFGNAGGMTHAMAQFHAMPNGSSTPPFQVLPGSPILPGQPTNPPVDPNGPGTPGQQPPPPGLPGQPELQPGTQVTNVDPMVAVQPPRFLTAKLGLAALVAALGGAALGVVVARRRKASAAT